MKKKIERAKGKLGILIPGLGTAATTFIAGVEAIKKGLAEPLGSLTQTGNIASEKKAGKGYSKLTDYVSLAKLKDIVFGGWDTYSDNLFGAAGRAQTLRPLLQQIKTELQTIVPMKAVVDESFLSDIDKMHVKQADNKFELAKLVMYDIENFSVANNCLRLIVIDWGAKERTIEVSEVHNSIEAFEEGLCNNHPDISPSMIYAYAALSLGVPFINGSGNSNSDIPALTELAKSTNTPVAGKDFKTRQPFKSTDYLPASDASDFAVKNVAYKKNDLDGFKAEGIINENILQIQAHKAHQNSPDKIKIGFPASVFNQAKKILGFFPEDIISGASVVLDVALFIDLAKRAGMRGIQEWLSFYFTAPQAYPRLAAEHNASEQLINLQNALYYLKGKDLMAHHDLDYYE